MDDGWKYAPAVLSHVYWRQKEQFQFDCDTYGEWVLFAVTEGRFRYRIEDTSGVAGFGDLVFCPLGAAFHREVVEPLSFHFYRFRWVRTSAEGEREQAEGGGLDGLDGLSEQGALGRLGGLGGLGGFGGLGGLGGPGPRPVGKISILDHSRLSSTYTYLQQLAGVSDERRIDLTQALFQDLWSLACMESELAQLQGTAGGTKDAEMAEAAFWIRQHAFGPLRMKDYSAAKQMSAVQLTRRFQAAWGQTPMEYLTSLRIQRAKALLLDTRSTLDDIAVQCGYENGFYLSRVFTKKVKVTPSQYRKLNRL